MALIIDSHTHIFSRSIKKLLTPYFHEFTTQGIEFCRDKLRGGLNFLQRGAHYFQPLTRRAPESVLRITDAIGYTGVLPGLLFESSKEDLLSALSRSKVSHALVIASPPYATNEMILEAHKEHSNLIPVVNIPPKSESSPENAKELLKTYLKRGARALKIHAALDGESVESEHYNALLSVADSEGLPVILHTGCIHMKLVYKDPEMGHVEQFKPWFEKYKNIPFVIAHMNFHYPEKALQICEKYSQLSVDTSWQPEEIIAQAVKRLGSNRVLYGSDWPLLGNNIKVCLDRIRNCKKAGKITAEEEEKILGQNALKLFRV